MKGGPRRKPTQANLRSASRFNRACRRQARFRANGAHRPLRFVVKLKNPILVLLTRRLPLGLSKTTQVSLVPIFSHTSLAAQDSRSIGAMSALGH